MDATRWDSVGQTDKEHLATYFEHFILPFEAEDFVWMGSYIFFFIQI